MVEVRGGARAIALGQVRGDDTDGPHPGRVLFGPPSAQVNRSVSLHQVDDPLAVQIDQPGHVDAPVLGRGREERGLVDAERPDLLHSLRVLDQWRAVEDHGVHHGPPAHPELAGHDGDRESELSDLAGGLCSGTQREHGPWGDVLSALGPRLGRAVGVDTAPAPLQPDQSCRATEAGQIPDVDPDAVLRLGAHAAGRAPHEVSRRLDHDDHLGGGLFHGQHPEAVESQQCFCQAGSVVHRQGSSSLGRQATSTMSGPLAAFADTSLRHAPQFNAKSQIRTAHSGMVALTASEREDDGHPLMIPKEIRRNLFVKCPQTSCNCLAGCPYSPRPCDAYPPMIRRT